VTFVDVFLDPAEELFPREGAGGKGEHQRRSRIPIDPPDSPITMRWRVRTSAMVR
jgi:hypothetical protein